MNTITFIIAQKEEEKEEELNRRIEAYVAEKYQAKIRKVDNVLKLKYTKIKHQPHPIFYIPEWLVEVELED